MTSVEIRPPAARSASTDLPESAESVEAARLYTAYSEQLVGFCARRLGSHTEAEDAVQLTFLYAFRALRRGVVPEDESAWLYAIAANVCRWQHRTRSRRGPPALELDLDRVVGATQSGADQKALCRDLKESLRTLPAAQRSALVLREWHGLPSREVAARLGMSPPATYALLTRARHSFVRAFEARREAVLGLQLAALAHQLRHQLKALFGTASAKTAAVATVAAVGVGGVAVERSLADRPPPPGPVSAAVEPVNAGTPVARSTEMPTTGPDATRVARRPQKAGSRRLSTRVEQNGGSRVAIAVPPRTPETPAAADTSPAPERQAEPTSSEPPAESLPAVPLHPPALPEPELPTDLLPRLDLPPLPLVEPPDLPPLPEIDLPPVEPSPLPPLPPLLPLP